MTDLVGDQPWTYVQATGHLYRPDGSLCATGYSGHAAGINNPGLQEIHDIGPLPCGLYGIGVPKDSPMLGPMAIPLHPDPTNQMFGRAFFFCHGDNARHDQSASEGCIIMPRPAREELAKGTTLRVIAEEVAEKLA